MAVQLGLLDNSVKLTDGSEDSLRQVLSLTADRYREYAAAIDTGESERSVYWRIVFSILSVHSPIDATFVSYKTLRLWHARFQRTPSVGTYMRMLRSSRGSDGVVQYIPTKSHYLREFDLGWHKDRTRYTRNDETDDAWRLRLQTNIKGLGMAKASFAVALSNPATSDVCCVDTHIYAIFNHGRPAKTTIGKRAYLAMEDRVRTLAKDFGLSVFACQWALWDARRGVCNPHAGLASI